MRIAIVGSGVSGLVCAHLLRKRHDVVLYEADGRPGGHSHTHRVELPEGTFDVDTGFLVYNERTYPLFCRLLDRLGVATQASDMSFGMSDERTGLEWRGTSPSTVFAQRRNLARPEFLRMLADVRRFNRLAAGLLEEPPPDEVTLEEVLSSRRWSEGFREWYLIPLGSSIWSAKPNMFTQIPAATFARFFERHGLLRLRDQPRWRTVTGGSSRYVEAILAPLAPRADCASVPLSTRSDASRERSKLSVPPESSRTTMSSSRPTAIRPCRCCRIPTGPSRRSWAQSATSRTGPPSIQMPASCHATVGPGQAGTTIAWRPTRTRRRSPTT